MKPLNELFAASLSAVRMPRTPLDGVKEDHRACAFKRAVPPLLKLRKNLVGHGADEIGADVHGVLFGEIGLDFPSGQTAGINGRNFLFETFGTALELRNALRQKTARTIIWACLL